MRDRAGTMRMWRKKKVNLDRRERCKVTEIGKEEKRGKKGKETRTLRMIKLTGRLIPARFSLDPRSIVCTSLLFLSTLRSLGQTPHLSPIARKNL